MNTTKLLGAIALAGLFSISSTFASTSLGGDTDAHGCIGSAGYSWSETQKKCVRVWEEKAKTYSTKEVFLKAEGKTCKMATDGCNSFFVKDGKIGGGTLMYCEDIYGKNGQEKWSCEDKKTSIENSYIVVLKKGTDKNSVISAVKKLANVEYGKIIFNTGDLVMFTIETTDKTAITKIEKITGVDYVEQNQEVSIDDPVEDNTKFIYGKITKIVQGADGQQITLETSNGTVYTTAVSVHDTVIEKYEAGYKEYGFLLGENVKVYYSEIVDGMNLLIGNKVEIISKGLSENDENSLKHLQKTLDKNLKAKVDSALTKYEKKLKKINNPQETNNKVIEKVEDVIFSKITMKYPQDVALPKKAATLYSALEYLKLSLMNIDFDEKNTAENQNSHTKTLEVIGAFGEMDGDSIELIGFDDNGEYDFAQKYSTIFSIPNLGDNYISVKQGDRLTITGEFSNNRIFSITKLTAIKNPKKEECEAQKNRKWKPQGKAQIPACITEYSDGGKTCTSSNQCEGNCIKTHPEKPAMCEANSSKFGCKTTIEKFNEGERILCMD